MSYLQNPAASAEAIVNGTDFSRESAAIFVGVGGNMNVIMRDGSTVLFTGVVAGTIIPVRATQVAAASTTATNLVALLN